MKDLSILLIEEDSVDELLLVHKLNKSDYKPQITKSHGTLLLQTKIFLDLVPLK